MWYSCLYYCSIYYATRFGPIMPSSGLYNSDILTKVHRQYYLRDPVVYNSIFYVKIFIKCRFSWVFLCFLLRRQSFSVMFRVCVCVGLVPCVAWF